jgi:hypothetical protein
MSLVPSDLAAQLLQSAPVLRQKLARALFCRAEECELALTEVIKFLLLAAESQTQLTPSTRIDLAWHEFILFTRTYLKFCEQTLGKMIHHEPSLDHQANSAQYLLTLELYRQRFGAPPPEYWGQHSQHPAPGLSAACGNCEADI